MLAETEWAAEERAEDKLWVAITLAGLMLVGVWLMEPCQVREMARS